MSESFDQLLSLVTAGNHLSFEQMTSAINAVMSGMCSEEQIRQFLIKLHDKGETVAEVAGAAAVMRQQMTTIDNHYPKLLDTCGTGGGGSSTFNISTASAIVIAATGVPVAKHGNRSVTSRSGSADVLAQLGVNIEASIPQVQRCLNELGICFCFAQRMHPAMRHVASVRKSLGIRTIFNILGPLSNPAGATHQLLGAGLPELRPLLASTLAMLGTERALVVSGEDGLGEVTLADKTQVTRVEGSQLQELQWTPEDFDIQQVSTETMQNHLRVDGPAASATIIREVLAGKSGLARDIVVLNAAAGLLAVGHCDQPKQAAEQAGRTLDQGKAATLLERLASLSHEDE